jgi:hypothetical protein
MELISYDNLREIFKDKSIAIVGSAPSVFDNDGKYIDSFDYVVRINNYKTRGFEEKTGKRTDVYYSFFGNSIKKTKEELINDGVKICMCKCPDSAPHKDSEYHKKNNMIYGTSFKWIYEKRKNFWFCPVYIPTEEKYLRHFYILGNHVPSTGFACILDFIGFDTEKLYITGFDFFDSKIHNVNERWRDKNMDDPIGHRPSREKKLLRTFMENNIILDKKLKEIL